MTPWFVLAGGGVAPSLRSASCSFLLLSSLSTGGIPVCLRQRGTASASTPASAFMAAARGGRLANGEGRGAGWCCRAPGDGACVSQHLRLRNAPLHRYGRRAGNIVA